VISQRDICLGYNLLAERGTGPQRIAVKTWTYESSHNFVGYDNGDRFEWLAVVIVTKPRWEGWQSGRIFILPRHIADERSITAPKRQKGRRHRPERFFLVPELVQSFPDEPGGLADYEDNFGLSEVPLRQAVTINGM